MRKRLLRNNSSLKIMAATSVILFSLLTCFAGVYAWFTSIRNVSNSSEHFKVEVVGTAVQTITFHEYQGTTDDGYYSFNPTASGSVTLEGGEVDDDDYEGIELGEYSLEDPNHPLLMMFEVSGGTQLIEFSTDFAYLAQDNISSLKATVATLAALNSYDKNTLSNGDYLKVTADEGHGGVTTIYKYVAATTSYDMAWIDLKVNGNPLSSVVQFHYFEFEGASIDAIKQNKYIDEVSTSGINIATSSFTNSNKSGFANFTDEDTFTYSKKINVYDGDVRGINYVGIVINYNSLALQYIFSKYLGSDVLAHGGLTFNCDWTTRV